MQSNKTIALLTTWLDGWYQSQLWKGAVTAAKASGARLFCLVGYAQPESIMPSGPESIYGLAARNQIDGVMLSSGPLSFWEGPKALDKIQHWLHSKPLVSLGYPLPTMDSVLPEGDGIEAMVAHMIVEHKCHRIAFLSGPPMNLDAQRRLKDYKDTLEKYGVKFDPNLVEVGGFYLEGGILATENLIAKKISFDAVIAANDTMAIGAYKVLKAHGFKIPNDIRISGYDDTYEGLLQQPPLSTVSNPTAQIAHRGLEICLQRLQGNLSNFLLEKIPTEIVIRKSCGCSKRPQITTVISDDDTEYLSQLILSNLTQNHYEFTRWFHEKLTVSNSATHELCLKTIESIRLYIDSTTNLQQYKIATKLLLQAEEIVAESKSGKLSNQLIHQTGLVRDLHRLSSVMNLHTEPKQMMARLAEAIHEWSPDGCRVFMIHEDFSPSPCVDLRNQTFAYRVEILDGTITQIPHEEDLLPSKVEPGEIWIGVPIEQGNNRYGVILFKNWVGDEAFVEHLRIVFSSAFAISWRTRSEAKLRETLMQLSMHDELTGLYNRRGLQKFSQILVNQAQREKKLIGIFFMDLDKLKEINDRFGHNDGDLAIATMGSALKSCFRDTDLVARIGGDEFVAVFKIDQINEPAMLENRLKSSLIELSASINKDWKVSSSVGYSVWNPCLGGDLDAEIEKADKVLYTQKAKKHNS